jgi:hypothetical protein
MGHRNPEWSVDRAAWWPSRTGTTQDMYIGLGTLLIIIILVILLT